MCRDWNTVSCRARRDGNLSSIIWGKGHWDANRSIHREKKGTSPGDLD